MQLKIVPGYEGGIVIGQRKTYVFYGNGPKSYANPGGDPLSGPFSEYIDYVAPTMSVSKTYEINFFPSTVGTTRATWTAKWYVVSTGAEVAGATDLSGESIQFMALAGEF